MTDQPDLDFGKPLPPIAERPPVNGYARRPGTGPDGETCGTCDHFRRVTPGAGTFFKCALVQWTHGPGTDIRMRSPACELWHRPGSPPPHATDGAERAADEALAGAFMTDEERSRR